MTVELNRTLFRRFVQLYLFTFVLMVPIAVYEVTTPSWAEFDAEFIGLLSSRFGWNNDNLAYWLPLAGLAIVHLSCAAGLLWASRWARRGFWLSTAAIIGFDLIFGPPATYVTGVAMLVDGVALLTSGAIILMAYARGAGAVWFGDEQLSKE